MTGWGKIKKGWIWNVLQIFARVHRRCLESTSCLRMLSSLPLPPFKCIEIPSSSQVPVYKNLSDIIDHRLQIRYSNLWMKNTHPDWQLATKAAHVPVGQTFIWVIQKPCFNLEVLRYFLTCILQTCHLLGSIIGIHVFFSHDSCNGSISPARFCIWNQKFCWAKTCWPITPK